MTAPGHERSAHSSGVRRRGQSSVIGVVLVVSVTVMGVTGIMLFGASALSDSHTRSEVDAAEHAMTQLDSQFSLVALGSAERQGSSIPLESGASLSVDHDEGWMNVSVLNQTDGTVNQTIFNTTLGVVTYENDGTTVAYQGGGVWRKAPDGGSVMISPPEFHYRIANGRSPTLTVPLVVVRGHGTLTERVTVESDEAIPKFPNSSDPALSNPLQGGKIHVTVHSAYYEAWGTFFEERTSSTVQYDRPNETVSVELTVPFDEEFSYVLTTTDPEGGNPEAIIDDPSQYQMGVGYPPADPLIEDRIEECEENESLCDDTEPSNPTSGTYIYDSDVDSLPEIDTSSGNVTLVVNGSFEPGTVDVDGPNSVTVLVREDFSLGGGDSINYGGDADAFTVVVHSEGDVTVDGKADFVGLLYAPGSQVEINGGGNGVIKGGIISETMDVSGGGAMDFEYDPSISGIDLNLEGEVATITHMHVTINQVNVSSR